MFNEIMIRPCSEIMRYILVDKSVILVEIIQILKEFKLNVD